LEPVDQIVRPETEYAMLLGNYPNPFNPSTELVFKLPYDGHATLEVFNIVGQRVATLVDEQMSAGEHRVIWNAQSDNGQRVPSGMYFYRLVTESGRETRKMLLLK
jgi:flagellar hook assembly protein FlgD